MWLQNDMQNAFHFPLRFSSVTTIDWTVVMVADFLFSWYLALDSKEWMSCFFSGYVSSYAKKPKSNPDVVHYHH